MSKVLQERGFRSLPSSTEANPRDHVMSISTTVEADTKLIRRMGFSQYSVSTLQNSKLMYETRQTTIPFPCHLNDYYYDEKKGSYGPQFSEAYSYGASHIDNSIPRKEKDPGSIYRTVKYSKGIAKNVLVELRRDQVDDLMPTVEEGEVIEEVKTRNDARMVSKIFGYPSNYDQSEKIRIDYAHNLNCGNMNPCVDEGMGEVVVGKRFCEDLAAKKLTILVKYLQSGILAQ
ncbi:hypothetical protein Tco_1564323 [Tanacetum coccineum]